MRPCAVIGPQGPAADRDRDRERDRAEALVAAMHQNHQGLQALQTGQGIQGHPGLQSHQSRWSQMCPPLFYPQRAYPPRDISPRHTFQENMSRVVVPAPAHAHAQASAPSEYDRRSYDKYAPFRSRQLTATSAAPEMSPAAALAMPVDRSFYQCYPQYSDPGGMSKPHPQSHQQVPGYHANHQAEASVKAPTVPRVDVRYDPYSSAPVPVPADYRFGYARTDYPYRPAAARLPPPQTYGSPYPKYGESYLPSVDPSQVPLQYQRYPDPQQFVYGVDPTPRATRMPPELGCRVAEVSGRSLQQYYGQDKYVFAQDKSSQRGTVVRSVDEGAQYYRNYGYPDGRPVADPIEIDFHKTMASQGMMKQPAPAASPYSDGRQFYGYQPRQLQTNRERLAEYDQAQYQRYYNRQKCISFNPLAKIPTQFSPDVISPTTSVTSLDSPNVSNHVYLEDPGYVSQCSTGSGHSAEYHHHHHQVSNACDPKHIFVNDDARTVYGCPDLSGRMLKSSPANGDRSKPSMDLRQFLQMWDEEYEDPNVCKISSDMSNPNESQPKREGQKGAPNSQQLYVLDKVNIASEELHKYEHLQQVTRLPDNIKDVQNSKNNFTRNVRPDFPKMVSTPVEIAQTSTKQSAISNEMVDVEAKITQSIIHKEVKCNFEIKPCSPGPVLCDVRPDVLAGVEPRIKVDIEYSSSPNETNPSNINRNYTMKPVFTDMTEWDGKSKPDSLQTDTKNASETFKESRKRASLADKSASKWKPNCSSPSMISSKNKTVELKAALDMPSNVAFVKPQVSFKNASKFKDNSKSQITTNEISTHLKKSVIVLRSETANSAECLTITNHKKCSTINLMTKEAPVTSEEVVSSHISMPILDSSQSSLENVKENESNKSTISDYAFSIKPDSIMDLLKPNSSITMLTGCSSPKHATNLEKSYISDDILPTNDCEKKCDGLLNNNIVTDHSISDNFNLNSLPILDSEYTKPESETDNSCAINKHQSPSISSSIISDNCDFTPINDFDMKSLSNLVNRPPRDANKSPINMEHNLETDISSENISSVNYGSFDSDSCEQNLFNSEYHNTESEDLSQTENGTLLEKLNKTTDESPKMPNTACVVTLKDDKKSMENDFEYSKSDISMTKEQHVENVSMLLDETDECHENPDMNELNTTTSMDNENNLNSCENLNESWLSMEEKVCDMLDSTISPMEDSINEDSIECKNESKESCTLSSPIYSPKASVDLSCLHSSDDIKDSEMIMLTYSHIDEAESLDFMHNDDEYKLNSSYDDTRNVFLFVDSVSPYKDGLKDANANDNFLFESLSPKYKKLRHDEMDSDSYDFEQSKTDNSTDFDHEMDFTSSVAVDGLELGGCWIDDIACVETVGSNDEADEINNYEEEKQNIQSPHTPEYAESDDCSQNSDNLKRDSNGNIIFGESSVDDINSNNRYKIINDTSNSSLESKKEDCKPSLKLNIKKSVVRDGSKSEKKYEIIERKKYKKDDSHQDCLKRKYREYHPKKKKRINTYSQSEPQTGNGVLITKGAKKYIPPLESDLKYNPSLIGDEKTNKNDNSDGEGKLSVNRMVLPKKIPKPKFEDVLMHIDAANMSWNKLKLKQRKKVVPKMVIKKNDYGSHYTSSSKDESNDGLDAKHSTGWQPSVHLTRSLNIDKMLDGNKDGNDKSDNQDSGKCRRFVRKIKLKEYREKRERLPCIITISKSKAFPSQYTSQTSQQESSLQCTSRLINN